MFRARTQSSVSCVSFLTFLTYLISSGCTKLAIVDLKEEEAQNAAAELKAEFG